VDFIGAAKFQQHSSSPHRPFHSHLMAAVNIQSFSETLLQLLRRFAIFARPFNLTSAFKKNLNRIGPRGIHTRNRSLRPVRSIRKCCPWNISDSSHSCWGPPCSCCGVLRFLHGLLVGLLPPAKSRASPVRQNSNHNPPLHTGLSFRISWLQ
jgi:hypothetical protein